MNKKIKVLGCTALLLSALAPPANAILISQTEEIFGLGHSLSGDLSFERFDTTLGTLNSVTLGIWGNTSGLLNYENVSSISGELNATIGASFDVLGPAASLWEGVKLDFSSVMRSEYERYDGVYDFDGTSGATGLIYEASGSEFVSSTDQLDLTPFLGPGALTIGVSGTWTESLQQTPLGPIIVRTHDEQMSFAATLVYGYEAPQEYVYEATRVASVPEPSISLLIASGLMVLGVARRKSRV